MAVWLILDLQTSNRPTNGDEEKPVEPSKGNKIILRLNRTANTATDRSNGVEPAQTVVENEVVAMNERGEEVAEEEAARGGSRGVRKRAKI